MEGMTFKEAYKEMQKGNKVRRKGFSGCYYIDQETGIFTIQLPDGKEIRHGKLDILAKNVIADDWEIVE